MARKTRIVLTDDLTDAVLEDGAGETVSFGLDGQAYEIDLSAENAGKLRDDFARYVGHGRRKVASSGSAGRQSGNRSRSSAEGKRDLGPVRKWARQNGHDVSERGRVKASVIEAYDAAH
jgi:hypothetical protein